MVKVGGNSTLQLLQGITDLVEACLNFIHFDTWSRNQDVKLPLMRVLVTPAVYPPRVFEFLITSTFGAQRKNHIASTASEDITKK